MITSEEIFKIGKFQKTHALKGELNVILDIDPEYFQEGNPLIVMIDGILVPFYIETIRKKGSQSYLVKLQGIDSEEDARMFVNKEISILRKDAEELLDDEELLQDEELIGYEVFDKTSNSKVGVLTGIDSTTSNVLFLVDNSGETIYIPATEDFIIKFDDENKSILMQLPEGLIDLNTKDKNN